MKKLLLCLFLCLGLVACSSQPSTNSQSEVEKGGFTTANRESLTVYISPKKNNDRIDLKAGEGEAEAVVASIVEAVEAIATLEGEECEEAEFTGLYYIVRDNSTNTSMHLYEDGHSVTISLGERVVKQYDVEQFGEQFAKITSGIEEFAALSAEQLK